MKKWFSLRSLAFLASLFASLAALSAADGAPAPKDPAYAKVARERADKIVPALGVSDSAKAARVAEIIAGQYEALKALHDARDARIAASKTSPSAKADAEAARGETDAAVAQLHAEYLAKLAVELTPEQIDKVKDGMTYGVLPNTYRVYLKMMPDLTAEQKTQILAWLTEAREKAMDGGSSDEKHAWFGKYKGKINNYLSKAGYNMKDAEKNLRLKN